jgi:Ca2+-binding EF-hand superfamily protein
MAAELGLDGSIQIGREAFEGMLLRMYHAPVDRGAQRRQCSVALHRHLGPELGPAALRTRCRDLFRQFDADGSGRIDLGELLAALAALGVADLAEEGLLGIMDELGIDQGAGEDAGLDFPGFGELVGQLYAADDGEEGVWERARRGLVRLFGAGLGDAELWDRTDTAFLELDADGSGQLDMTELDAAMRLIGVQVRDDELARMVEEAEAGGRLWVVRASNSWGHTECFLRITVLEGVSELQYASVDTFCRVGDKFPPLKVARLKGAAPFAFVSVSPALPEGMMLDSSTGTISGRPLEERPKAEYTVTATNAVGSTSGSFFLQTLVEPSDLQFEHTHCIYKEGRLKFPAWAMARDGMLRQLGPSVRDDTLTDLAKTLFDSMDADHSGQVSVEELKGAFESWQVQVSDEDLAKMVAECVEPSPVEKTVTAAAISAAPETQLKDQKEFKDAGKADSVSIELDFGSFLEVIRQAYFGYKSGADRFKTEPLGEWVSSKNIVSNVLGTAPFIFSVAPPLPDGLQIDRESGTIHGVPHSACYSAIYTIQAKNRVGEVTCNIVIEVLEPPSNLAYPSRAYLLPSRQSISPIKCVAQGTRDAQCGKMVFRAGRDPVQVVA